MNSESVQYLISRLERVLDLVNEGNNHMAAAKLMADIAALKIMERDSLCLERVVSEWAAIKKLNDAAQKRGPVSQKIVDYQEGMAETFRMAEAALVDTMQPKAH